MALAKSKVDKKLMFQRLREPLVCLLRSSTLGVHEAVLTAFSASAACVLACSGSVKCESELLEWE